ncbi:MAG TPA: glutamate-cysteine ligase family protein [Candidatus Polarisedimenticolia bacterium]|nr:glutamate-cysteine ligase family protein [Candidatus Polarisedimenticolia bacterium]
MGKDRALTGAADLQDYFEAGSKPREDWGVGIEYERVGVFTDTGRAIPYHGQRSLSALLARLVSREGWRPRYSGPHIIALENDLAAIHLEPGGQLELSGAVHRRLLDLREEVLHWASQIQSHSEPLGITWLGIGLQPFSALSDIEWVPKPRYAIMSAHLARTGTMGHVMMKQTAGIQTNLDYEDEEDALEKFRVAMGLTSVVTAIFANSPLAEGRPNGYLSYRGWAWQNTDPARCGLLPFVLDPGARFQDYLEYALNVPTMFIVRNGTFIDLGGIPFGKFLESGFGGHHATRDDFQLHLTTLFPEVRLKHYLEIRGGDTADPELAVAQVAFWKGILYDSAARREAWNLVANVTWEERLQFHREACRLGTESRLGGRSVLEIGADLYRIAAEGLDRQGEPPSLLDRLGGLVAPRGGSPGKVLAERWLGEWKQDPARLIDYGSRMALRRIESTGGRLVEDH